MDIEQLIAKGYELLTVFGVKILAALAVFIIGRWIVKYLRRLIRRVMEKRRVDATLTKFLTNLSYVALLTFVIPAAKLDSEPCNARPMARPAAPKTAIKDVVWMPSIPNAAIITKVSKAT